MGEYTLNINLNGGLYPGQAGALPSEDVQMLAQEIRTVRSETEAYRAKFESYVDNIDAQKEAEDAAAKQRSEALRKANEEKAALTRKHRIERTAAISSVVLGLDIARFASNKASAIYQNKAMANQISNATTTAGYLMGAGATGVAIGKSIASGNYVMAAIMAVASISGTVISLVQKLQTWDYTQNKNMAEEARSSDRLGIVISQRNRMR